MLELFVQIVLFVYDVMGKKGSVVLFDHEKYLAVQRGERISWPVKVGDKIVKGSSAEQCLKSGEKVIVKIGPEVLGFPYFAIAHPIKAEGRVFGGIAVGVPTELIEVSDELRSQAVELVSSLQEISAAMEHLVGKVERLGCAGTDIWNSAAKAGEGSQETEEVIRFIDSVAKNTKLLGLNASIEAARAGEWGRGFSVVAAEIQKMAFSSASSTGKIRDIISGIRANVNDIAGQAEDFKGDTQEVLAALEEIEASLESIGRLAERLHGLAEKL
ncbi:MAG: methyl-accepting chemotaxis protein [Desulfitobacteriaceae bacterium]